MVGEMLACPFGEPYSMSLGVIRLSVNKKFIKTILDTGEKSAGTVTKPLRSVWRYCYAL